MSIRRGIDVAVSLAGLAVAGAAMAAIAAAQKLTSDDPVLYIQPRQGLDGKYFNMYKFRSMTNARDAEGRLLPDRDRITTLGRFLRRTSLDELPQLFNILKGDMSIIGPRPAYFRVPEEYNERFAVKPGLTGLAQIRGRKDCSLHDRLSSDIEYIQTNRRSTYSGAAAYDLKILFNTVAVVASGKGTGCRPVIANPDYAMTMASQAANGPS